MLFVDIGTQKRKIGRIELQNVGSKKNGICHYKGVFVNEGKARIEFEVDHKRTEGALKLLEKAFKRAKKVVDEYYTYPESKVQARGLIKDSDIPERWRNEFGKWLGIATVSLLDGETAFNLRDVDGFLESRKNGFVPMWD